MLISSDVVTHIIRRVSDAIKQDQYIVLQGNWVAAEGVDADLSEVVIEGITCRGVRKLEHVTGLAAGNQVLCLKGPGLPVTIVGRMIGDITLYTAGG